MPDAGLHNRIGQCIFAPLLFNPMKNPFPLAVLFCLIIAGAKSYAQEQSFLNTTLSTPTDLPTIGWNKTLVMRDGRTFVIHVAASEKMYVKVYDTAHRETVSVRQLFKVISEGQFYDTDIWGPYDIDGWPTLLATQLINGENGLVRVRFNPNTGAIQDEIIVRSEKFGGFNISKSPNSDDYAILHPRRRAADDTSQVLEVTYWNGRHEKVREARFVYPVTRLNVHVLNFYYDKQVGTALALAYAKETNNGNGEQYVWTGFIQQADSISQASMVKMPASFNPVYGLFQYNAFAGTVNLSVTGHVKGKVIGKVWDSPVDYYTSFLIVFSQPGLEPVSAHQLFNTKANDFLQAATDTGHNFIGMPYDMYTNKFGITSILCGNRRGIYASIDGQRRSYQGLSFTRLDDKGEEMTGLVLPKANFPWYDNDKNMVMSQQMSEVFCTPERRDHYIFFNDNPANFPHTLADSTAIIKSFEDNEAMCYHISAQDKVDKTLLFGPPTAGESKSLIVGSLSRQQDGKLISSLVYVKKGKEKHVCIAWCTLP